jgi:hypothetical protein
MNLLERLQDLLNEMAYSRQSFMDRLRGLLAGALTEYTCDTIAAKVNIDYNWSKEVKRILDRVPKMMDKKIKTRFKDRTSALQEVMYEVSIQQDRLTKAKNKVIHENPHKGKEIRALDLESEQLFADMIHKYLPQYADLLPDED